jgi:hypothetical protein
LEAVRVLGELDEALLLEERDGPNFIALIDEALGHDRTDPGSRPLSRTPVRVDPRESHPSALGRTADRSAYSAHQEDVDEAIAVAAPRIDHDGDDEHRPHPNAKIPAAAAAAAVDAAGAFATTVAASSSSLGPARCHAARQQQQPTAAAAAAVGTTTVASFMEMPLFAQTAVRRECNLNR